MYNKILFTSAETPHALDPSKASELLATLLSKPFTGTPRRVDKPLVLYGAGNLGRMAKDYLARLKIPISLVIDQNPDLCKLDPFWEGIDIVAPKDVAAANKKTSLLAVSVCTIPYSDLFAVLIGHGWEDVVPFYDIAQEYRNAHPLNNGWFTGVLSEQDIYGIERVIRRWDDDISRAHHLQFMAWHSFREDWVFEGAPVTTHNRYFIPEVRAVLHDHETFLDVGAHHGEVTIKFLETVDHQFKAIWVIEPDIINLRDLYAEFNFKLIGEDVNKINVLTCAVGETSGRQGFFEGIDYSSQFSELGQCEIEVKTIDDFGLSPTFIKFHLEGHELSALKGSLRTIKDHRPIIAATTYHNYLGLWQVPVWLMANLSDYTFLLRLHSWCGTGSVIYAIPIERTLTSRQV
jgi:FkbM family methyltransferase